MTANTMTNEREKAPVRTIRIGHVDHDRECGVVLIKPAAPVLAPVLWELRGLPFSALVGPMNAWRDSHGTQN